MYYTAVLERTRTCFDTTSESATSSPSPLP